MSKYDAVPYSPHGHQTDAVLAGGGRGLGHGGVPYISWADGAPDVEDTDPVWEATAAGRKGRSRGRKGRSRSGGE